MIIAFVIAAWLVVAVVVIAYPLVAGRIRVGLETVHRDDDAGAFWKAYAVSTVLFVCVSIAAGLFLRSILP